MWCCGSAVSQHRRATTASQVRAAGLGFSTEVGLADGYQPLIRIDDAADAVATAVTAPSGVYNVVDDGLLTRRQVDGVLATAVGRKRLWRPLDHAPKASVRAATCSRRRTECRISGTRTRRGGVRPRAGRPRACVDSCASSATATGVCAASRGCCCGSSASAAWPSVCRRCSHRSTSTTSSRSVEAGSRWTRRSTNTSFVMWGPSTWRWPSSRSWRSRCAARWRRASPPWPGSCSPFPHGIFHAAHLHHMPAGDTIGLVLGTAGPAFLALLVLVLPVHAPPRGSFSVPA